MGQFGFWAAGAVVAASAAVPAQAEELRRFDIAAQPAQTGLPRFARQAGIDILAPQELIGTRRVNAVRGQMTVREGLSRLLHGTSLVVVATARGAMLVRAAPAATGGRERQDQAAPSNASSAPAPQTASAEATSPDPQENAAAPEPRRADDVVVTGSRVIRNGNNSPTPVTVASSEDLLRLRPTTLVSSLSSLPAFSGNGGAESSTRAGPGNGGNGAAALADLRNLTPDRTLVLLDGQRFPPTLFTGGVDINAIPELMISRVDVVTGGVSAVYGSDAVAGVVNFVTDTKFTGIKAVAQTGFSTYGDDTSYKVGVAGGTRLLDDRLHVEASYLRIVDNGVLDRQDRAFVNNTSYGGSGTAASPYTVYQGTRSSNTSFGGLIGGRSSLAGYVFDANGVATPFVHGTTIANNIEVGGDGAYNDASLKSPLTSDQGFVRADFDPSSHIHIYTQLLYNDSKSFQYYGWTALSNLTLSSTNPFLSSANQALLTGGGSTFTLTKIFNQAGFLKNSSDERQLFGRSGISGDLGRFKWGLDVSVADTRIKDTISNNLNNQHLAAALDAVLDSSGNIVCRSASANPGCVPLNLFGPTSASQAALAYVFGTTHLDVRTKFYDGLAHIGGDLFNLPAGPLAVSLTGEARRNTLSYYTDHSSDELVNCSGIALGCRTTSTLYSQVYGNRSPVSQDVEEGAAEVAVPVLKDVPFFQSLDLNGAARYTHYSNAGSYWTWKAGLSWKPGGGLTIRGTASRDIHAPTLYQQFQPLSVTPNMSANDYLTGQSITYSAQNIGNPALKAEIGHTQTVGAIWQPERFLPGFSVSVDYFHITVDNAIQQVRGWDAAIQQSCVASGGTSPYCALEVRPLGFTNTTAANNATAFIAQYINIASVRTYGVDVELGYRTKFFDRPVALRLLGTYQPHLRVLQPGITAYDCAGAVNCAGTYTASPRIRLTGSVHADVTEWLGLDVQERFRGRMRQSGETPTAANVYAAEVPAQGVTDLTATVRVGNGKSRPEVFFNVQNLFNATPPLTAVGPGPNAPSLGYAFPTDDPVGRYFTAGLRTRF